MNATATGLSDGENMPASHIKTLAEALRVSLLMVSALFLIEGADLVLRRQYGVTLAGFGIVPRTAPGLIGIVFSPLLHGSPAHLLANALPLLILLTLLYWDRHYYPALTLGTIWFFSGLGTWLIGRGNTVHIGASSIIFGLASYLIVAGVLMKSWRSAVISILVFILFGGIFYGMLPQPGPISWEGHLSGAIAGIWAAKRNHE